MQLPQGIFLMNLPWWHEVDPEDRETVILHLLKQAAIEDDYARYLSQLDPESAERRAAPSVDEIMLLAEAFRTAASVLSAVAIKGHRIAMEFLRVSGELHLERK